MAQYLRGSELVSFWDTWLSDNHMRWLSREQWLRCEHVVRGVERLDLGSARILDIGCAHGWVVHELLRFGRVTGIDISDVAIEAAREQIPEAEFHAGDFVELRLPEEGGFDVIVCLESIAYMDQPRFVDEVARLLRPGGHLILTTPNWPVWSGNGVGRASPSTVEVTHHSMDSLTALLGARLDVIDATTLNHRGLMRLTDSRKVSRVLGSVVGRSRLVDLRHRIGKLGRGWTLYVVARKPIAGEEDRHGEHR